MATFSGFAFAWRFNPASLSDLSSDLSAVGFFDFFAGLAGLAAGVSDVGGAAAPAGGCSTTATEFATGGGATA